MIRDAIKRNRSVGRAAWVEQTAVAGGPGAVPATPRPPGRMAQTHGSEWERHLTVRGTFISIRLRAHGGSIARSLNQQGAGKNVSSAVELALIAQCRWFFARPKTLLVDSLC